MIAKKKRLPRMPKNSLWSVSGDVSQIDKRVVRKAMRRLWAVIGVEWECHVECVQSQTMQSLNWRYRLKNQPTDVLSFLPGGMLEFAPKTLGDLVIAVDVARRQAYQYGHTFEQECMVLCAHGILHLLGYDHERSALDSQHQQEIEMQWLDAAGLNPCIALINRVETK